jgi:hypothetical protein
MTRLILPLTLFGVAALIYTALPFMSGFIAAVGVGTLIGAFHHE